MADISAETAFWLHSRYLKDPVASQIFEGYKPVMGVMFSSFIYELF